MSNIVYLKLVGKQQGDISSRCGTTESVGNHWQRGHEDEIFVFSLSASTSNTGLGVNLHALTFCKALDKSSPLLANAITNNETLFMEFWLYRINRYGRWERYYYIQLRGASLSRIYLSCRADEQHVEHVSVVYDYILCKHLISNTEFSYFALPADYNNLFVPPPKPTTTTLNSAAVGRLLAAGGLYNGNIEGFRDTAEKLGGDAVKGYEQVLNEKTAGIAIAAVSVAAAYGAGKMGSVNELYELEKINPNLHVLGKVEGNYTAMSPGPLKNKYAKTFSGAVYKEITLSQDTVFYRSGVKNVPLGEFMAYEQPLGILQARVDKAIRPKWPDGGESPIDSFYEIQIPSGTKVYVGQVGFQTDLYLGGTEQVLIIKPWEIPGVKILNNGELH